MPRGKVQQACPICGKSFFLYSSLQEHVQKCMNKLEGTSPKKVKTKKKKKKKEVPAPKRKAPSSLTSASAGSRDGRVGRDVTDSGKQTTTTKKMKKRARALANGEYDYAAASSSSASALSSKDKPAHVYSRFHAPRHSVVRVERDGQAPRWGSLLSHRRSKHDVTVRFFDNEEVATVSASFASRVHAPDYLSGYKMGNDLRTDMWIYLSEQLEEGGVDPSQWYSCRIHPSGWPKDAGWSKAVKLTMVAFVGRAKRDGVSQAFLLHHLTSDFCTWQSRMFENESNDAPYGSRDATALAALPKSKRAPIPFFVVDDVVSLFFGSASNEEAEEKEEKEEEEEKKKSQTLYRPAAQRRVAGVAIHPRDNERERGAFHRRRNAGAELRRAFEFDCSASERQRSLGWL